MKDARHGASGDVLHEDGRHPLMKGGPQEAHNVGVPEGFQELHFPPQTSVLSLRGVRLRGIQAHLLHGDQLAVAGQAAVDLARRQPKAPDERPWWVVSSSPDLHILTTP